MSGRGLLAGTAARLDGLAVLLFAVAMGWLTLRGNYWLFLNPKFAPLTPTAAGLLAILGAYATVWPVSRVSPSRLACYAVLAAMVALAASAPDPFAQTADADPFASRPSLPELTRSPAPSGPMRLGGKEYIPINTGELYDIVSKPRGETWEKDYVMRGYASRSPDLDAKREFVLYRLAIWCCFADATAVGFRVRLPEGEKLPENGQWLVVYGRLADAPEDERREYVLPGLPFSSVAPAALFAADHLEVATPALEEINMYEWHKEPPYAY